MNSNTSGQHITRRDGWQPEPVKNNHPTVKPTDLMAYLCRLVTPPGGLVLDPFMGSGSTGKAAMREGFRFVGIDMTPEYVEIARARIAHELSVIETAVAEASRQADLFGEAA
ncbi:DNA methyltransferase [Cupriavidus sp. UYPR2.512]|uniref:DNA methyltransferase n=1 Tax=Cupriavidus sp. UYPR2.512 TaxID=1080187 RepID=UPI00350EB264